MSEKKFLQIWVDFYADGLAVVDMVEEGFDSHERNPLRVEYGLYEWVEVYENGGKARLVKRMEPI